MKIAKIPTFVGLIILVGVLIAGVFLVRYRQAIFKIGASPEQIPKDVKLSNLSDASFTVTWITDAKTSGFVRWGKSVSNTPEVVSETSDTPGSIHSITVTSLSPETSYFFRIGSSGNLYDNNGVPWEAKTGPALPPSPKTSLISGTVVDASGAKVGGALVFASVGGSSPLSTLTSQEGTWAIPLTLARTADLSAFQQFDPNATLVEISVFSGTQVASALAFAANANPLPAITLGQNSDFRNSTPQGAGSLPTSTIGLPTNEATPASGFTVGNIATPSATTVTLKSIDPGEVITTTKPELFGSGPSGTKITIKVESEVQTTQLTVPTSGAWNWTPPKDLSVGTHTITITWKDASGVLRTLTRTFIVQASEGPAFVSTPSATPKSTPTASPTATPKVTATPAATKIATSAGTPATGSLTPTLAFFIMGVSVIAFSVFVWKRSEN